MKRHLICFNFWCSLINPMIIRLDALCALGIVRRGRLRINVVDAGHGIHEVVGGSERVLGVTAFQTRRNDVTVKHTDKISRREHVSLVFGFRCLGLKSSIRVREEVGLRLVEVQQRVPDCPRDGVTFRARDSLTSRDSVTLCPSDGVTSDVTEQSRLRAEVFQTRVSVRCPTLP